MARRESRDELLARVEVLREVLREREAELGVLQPLYGRGRAPRTGRLQARAVAAGIAVRAAERQLLEHDRDTRELLATR